MVGVSRVLIRVRRRAIYFFTRRGFAQSGRCVNISAAGREISETSNKICQPDVFRKPVRAFFSASAGVRRAGAGKFPQPQALGPPVRAKSLPVRA
jgi:hypothetical protein